VFELRFTLSRRYDHLPRRIWKLVWLFQFWV